jgi:hypothetical protein
MFTRLMAVLVTALWITGCSGPTSSTSITTTSEGEANRAGPGREAALNNAALVRFFNADSQRMQLSVFSQKKPVFSDIAFKSITPYKEVERGVSQFFLRADGPSDLAHARRELFPGRHYTLIALPSKKGEARIESFSDNLGQIDPGLARVRLINATTTFKDLDLFAQGTNSRILRGSGSGDVVSFAEMYGGNVEIRANNKPAPRSLATLMVKPGKLYTFIAVDSGNALEVVQVVDQLE